MGINLIIMDHKSIKIYLIYHELYKFHINCIKF